jgi:hypothetical protein
VNYELGIVIPLKNAEQASQVACFQRPPRKYDLKKDVPWVRSLSTTTSVPFRLTDGVLTDAG